MTTWGVKRGKGKRCPIVVTMNGATNCDLGPLSYFPIDPGPAPVPKPVDPKEKK